MTENMTITLNFTFTPTGTGGFLPPTTAEVLVNGKPAVYPAAKDENGKELDTASPEFDALDGIEQLIHSGAYIAERGAWRSMARYMIEATTGVRVPTPQTSSSGDISKAIAEMLSSLGRPTTVIEVIADSPEELEAKIAEAAKNFTKEAQAKLAKRNSDDEAEESKTSTKADDDGGEYGKLV